MGDEFHSVPSSLRDIRRWISPAPLASVRRDIPSPTMISLAPLVIIFVSFLSHFSLGHHVVANFEDISETALPKHVRPSSDLNSARSSPPWERDLLHLHRKLVQIQSLSGDEKPVAEWLTSHLQSLGFETDQQSIPDEKGVNVRAWAKESKGFGGDYILVTSHIDTVPPYIPYHYDHKTQLISGRGSVDAKASVAAQITAVKNLLSLNPDFSASSSSYLPIHLLYVIGEETSGIGMRYFSTHPPESTTYSHAIFGEPTWGKLASGHKGLMMLRINATGKAAHSGYPWLGLSAVDMITDAVTQIRKAVDALEPSDRFGNTTVNFGQVAGGVAANVVAEEATAHVLFRLAQPDDQRNGDGDGAGGSRENKNDAVERMRALVHKAVDDIAQQAKDRGGALELIWEPPAYGPVSLADDVPGFESMVASYGTDVPNWTGPGSDGKRYLYGPGSILVAHGPKEALTVDELVESVYGYEKLLRHTLSEVGIAARGTDEVEAEGGQEKPKLVNQAAGE